jgi:hypothetical protein
MADNDIIAALPEDVLLQVLSRVANVKSLFMLAATCRRWLCRFTDRAFLRDLWGGQRAGDLLGFFFHPQRNSASTFAFLPAPPLRSLIPSSYDGEPLTARRGILLMRLSPSNDWSEATSHLLGLLNPITGEHHALPHLKGPSNLGSFTVTSCAIIVSDDLAGKQPPSSGRFMFSQLLVTTKHKSIKTVYLHSYSATRSSWAAPAVFLDLRRFSLVGEGSSSSAVVHRGAAHWLCTDHVARATRDDYLYKLSVEVGGTATATPRVSMTKLPVLDGGTPTPLLCVGGDGELTIVCVFSMHVRVWKQQRRGDGDGDGAAAWRRDVIWMPTEVSNYPKSYTMAHGLGRWGSVAMMYSSTGAVFVLDLDKKVMEKAMDCLLPLRMDHSLDRPPVPYEMDLVEFFLLQLGGLCRGDLQDNQLID